MKATEKSYRDFFVFSSGACTCSFRIREEGDHICLSGEEKEGGTVIFAQTLVFSAEEGQRVSDFAESLSESETFPRMMMELAEEFFS